MPGFLERLIEEGPPVTAIRILEAAAAVSYVNVGIRCLRALIVDDKSVTVSELVGMAEEFSGELGRKVKFMVGGYIGSVPVTSDDKK